MNEIWTWLDPKICSFFFFQYPASRDERRIRNRIFPDIPTYFPDIFPFSFSPCHAWSEFQYGEKNRNAGSVWKTRSRFEKTGWIYIHTRSKWSVVHFFNRDKRRANEEFRRLSKLWWHDSQTRFNNWEENGNSEGSRSRKDRFQESTSTSVDTLCEFTFPKRSSAGWSSRW